VYLTDGADFAGSKQQVLQGSEKWFSTGICDLGKRMLVCISKLQLDMTNASMEMTLIVTAIQKDKLVNFLIEKGSLGITSVTIYNLNTNDRKLITSFNNTKSGGSRNAAHFSINPMSLAEGGPLRSSFNGPSGLVWAFYYPWYGKGLGISWSNKRLKDKPLLTAYNSSDEATILTHIHMAKHAGIDGFIVSWDGSDTNKEILRKILEVGARENFKVTIYFESNMAQSEQDLLRMFRGFFWNFEKDEEYFHLNGRPVIFVYSVDSRPLAVWEDIFHTLGTEGHEAFYVAESNSGNTDYLEVFDGIHIYGTYGTSKFDDLNATYRHLQLSTRSFSLLHSSTTSGKLWAATLMPGFDDTLLQRRTSYYLPRDDGNTYRKTFDAALRSGPDWILITSFNEWLENTYIEPSVTYGWKYLDLTAQFSGAFKNTSTSSLTSTNTTLFASQNQKPLSNKPVTFTITLNGEHQTGYAARPSTGYRSSDPSKKNHDLLLSHFRWISNITRDGRLMKTIEELV
jgi:hypothetical protein